MENFENEQLPLQPEPQSEPEQHAEPELEPITEPTPPPQKKRRARNAGRVLLVIVLIAALMAATFCATSVFYSIRLSAQEKRTEQTLAQLKEQVAALQEELSSKSFTGNGNSISGTPNSGADGSLTPGQVYAQVEKSIVAVTSKISTNNGSFVSTGVSYGTGFVWSEDGYIVTNHHVIDGGTTLSVTMYDGKEYDAVLCGSDSANDLAVLKIEAEGLQAVQVGSSSDLIVGDQVAVVGNALGELNSTLTVGYISAKDRVISTDGSLINMLQTDAAVNSGNSGGPIFNMKGEVVGIITAKYSGTSTSGASIEGIGFAIPIDDVTRKIEDLAEFGYITGAYLGVLVQDMDQDVAEYYGLPLGTYVAGVTAGYCAEEAGLQAKDIIIGLGDYTVTCMNDLTRALQNFQAGDTTVLTVWRSGLQLELEVTLDEKPVA